MCKFSGKWIGKGYTYTKNTTSDDVDIIKVKDFVEIDIRKQSKYIYEIKLKANSLSLKEKKEASLTTEQIQFFPF